MTAIRRVLFSLTAIALLGVGAIALVAAEPKAADSLATARKLMKDGNYKEAFEKYRTGILDSDSGGAELGQDVAKAVQCLNQLNRQAEIDEFREAVAEKHAEHPLVLKSVAETYLNQIHYGYLIGDEFHRGYQDARGEWVNATDRDRVRALQLLMQAVDQVKSIPNDEQRADVYRALAQGLLQGRGYNMAWQLQELTELSELPDFERNRSPRYGWRQNNNPGAPVDADGKPIYYHLPDSFEAAKNDGERWRWALNKQKEALPSRANEVDLSFAAFLRSQFGVPTIRSWQGFERLIAQSDAAAEADDNGGNDPAANPYALHTLSDDETIAKLASGVKRFTLPDEFNFMKIYQRVAATQQASAIGGMTGLAEAYTDRRQFPKAAEQWRATIDRFGKGHNDYRQKKLEQIVSNWVMFENVRVQAAGEPSTVDLRFRNGEKIKLKAERIDLEKLITDLKSHLKSNPRQVDYQKINLSNLGYRIVREGQKKYLTGTVAEWDVELSPRPDHVDTRTTIETPLKDGGAYLLSGTMENGNTSRIIIWVTDTAIVRKQLDNEILYYVADARAGEPVSGANVEYFGWRSNRRNGGRLETLTDNFAARTDEAGQVVLGKNKLKERYQYATFVRTEDGRFGMLGFQGVWYGRSYQQKYEQNKAYLITDRPIYRPEQKVKFKFWVRRADYTLSEDANQFAGQQFTVRMNDPRGEKVLEKTMTADEYGGFEGDWEVPDDAALGQYNFWIVNRGDVSGGGQFRIEEYKKPEFEVTVDAPDEPVALGETIEATIKANYYFGAPVTHATVHYKVTRKEHDTVWYPPTPWDWFYGNGYWWFSPEYDWYPGFGRWGCRAPLPPWHWAPQNPPELVLENEVEIGEDGTVKVEIDTELAKVLFGDSDHEYEITAEVTDQSRRTIVGTGSVLAPAEPFKVFAWVDRGFYRAGDTVKAHFKAQTPDRKPVEGQGELTLLSVAYDDEGNPTETPIETWQLNTDAQGEASQQLTAAEPGQYRLKYVVTDDEGHAQEGGYLLNVLGREGEPDDFRYNALELIVEQKTYQPGDTAKLLITTDRPGATVLVFPRPTNGVYSKPEVLKLTGKRTVYEMKMGTQDMPNSFVEVMTVGDGEVHTVAKELFVPPQKRVLDVSIEPSSESYRPGEDAEVTVTVKGPDGNPVTGSLAATIFDKSVEYISGGPNVGDIKEHFWKWRRNHNPSTYDNLSQWFSQVLKNNEESLQYLGTFGYIAMEESKDAEDQIGQRENERSGVNKNRRKLLGGLGGGGAFGEADRAGAPTSMAVAADGLAGESRSLESNFRKDEKQQAGGQAGPKVEPTVRTKFADTAYWNGGLELDGEGRAKIKLTMPENLTGWKIRTWAVAPGTRVGEATSEVVTRKNLLVRLQAPRFFTETDEVVLSANVHNYLATAKQAEVVLELGGRSLALLDGDQISRTVTVPADGEVRVDWRVKAVYPGEAVVTMKALTDEESDAMQMKFPVQEHGIERQESYTGIMLDGVNSEAVNFSIPAQRRPEDSRVVLQYSPSLASAMVDALPYLADYPYGCTEQTLNRFLPTVITQSILLEMDIDLEEVRKKQTNLNPGELGDPQERAAQWARMRRHDKKLKNPVWDRGEVDNMVTAGVTRLTNMQDESGGWGWFSGFRGTANPHITALVVHGLQIARENDVAIVPGVLEKGVDWLKRHQQEQIKKLQNAEKDPKVKPYKLKADNLDAFVHMVLVDAGVRNEVMATYLYRDRLDLSGYSLAMYAISLHETDSSERLAMVRRNLEQYLVVDDENDTAYLRLGNSGWWWYWYGSEIEANAYYLKLLSRLEPNGDVAPKLVKYLLNNRKHATYWNSTRDSAIAIEALGEYLRASGETSPDMTIEVFYDGNKEKEVRVTGSNLFTYDAGFEIFGDAVTTGDHTIELRRKGEGPLYWNAYVINFDKRDFIPEAGLEIKVERIVKKLIPKDATDTARTTTGSSVEQRVEAYDREPLDVGATLESGDLVEIELIVESKNDYEYILIEDMKAAGFEPVDVRSGYTGNSLGAYQEMRDEKVAFFIERLPRGTNSLKYRLRAEIPGDYSALPAIGSAMYAPELKANSNEWKGTIVDAN
ncbi:alpha-2-macroglobulin family protein [Stratiformator vulcanicus]|uniref:MG2 domain protein n=1 Tax=Stratiformator vulcanicus TaxID=2527980 RepID=A0A517QX06_9PLAN|nr:MG2 domain-containing protein [Stratiformator vulcanicus]QDT36171.1 MG2 domain protein [Stratiformator vulcanicus]